MSNYSESRGNKRENNPMKKKMMRPYPLNHLYKFVELIFCCSVLLEMPGVWQEMYINVQSMLSRTKEVKVSTKLRITSRNCSRKADTLSMYGVNLRLSYAPLVQVVSFYLIPRSQMYDYLLWNEEQSFGLRSSDLRIAQVSLVKFAVINQYCENHG